MKSTCRILSFGNMGPGIKTSTKEHILFQKYFSSDAKYSIRVFQCLLLMGQIDLFFFNNQEFTHGATKLDLKNAAKILNSHFQRTSWLFAVIDMGIHHGDKSTAEGLVSEHCTMWIEDLIQRRLPGGVIVVFSINKPL